MHATASDGIIMYNKATLSETYLKEFIVPHLKGASCTPFVSIAAEMPQPCMVLDWRAPGAGESDMTYVIVVDRLGGESAAS